MGTLHGDGNCELDGHDTLIITTKNKISKTLVTLMAALDNSSVFFWVGHSKSNHLSIEGPFESEDAAVEADVEAVAKMGQEFYIRRHTCPVLREDALEWKRKLLKNFARQKRVRKESEKQRGNNSSQFRDIYGSY